MAASSLAARRACAPVAASTASPASCTPITLAPARPAALLARRAWLPTTTPSRRALLCRAADGEDQQQQQSPAEAPPAASSSGSGGAGGSSQEQLKRPVVEDPSIAKGQRTAIITGAISIIFGVRVPVAVRAGAAHAPWSHGCPLLRGCWLAAGSPPCARAAIMQVHAIGTALQSCISLQSVLAWGLQLHNATTAADEAPYLPAKLPQALPRPHASAPLASRLPEQHCLRVSALPSPSPHPAPLLQVIYLALVSFLDMRGGELLPPPPEAYLP